MRRRVPVWLLATSVLLHGCLENLVGPLLAPQAVAAGTASALVDRGAAALDGASTASDIDRIIAANPDAANHGELLALRDGIAQRSLPETSGKAPSIPLPPDEFDRRAPQPATDDGTTPFPHPGAAVMFGNTNHGNRLVIQHEVIDDLSPANNRSETRPFSTARTSSLPPAQEPIYQYGWNPDPKPLEPRRGSE